MHALAQQYKHNVLSMLSSTSTWMMMRRDSLELALISLANHGLAFARGRQRTIRTTFSIWLSPFLLFLYMIIFFIIRRMRLNHSFMIFTVALRIWQAISCIQRFHLYSSVYFIILHDFMCVVWLFTLNGSFQARMAACQSPSYLNNDRSPSRSVLVPPTPPWHIGVNYRVRGSFWFYVGLDSDPEPAGFSCLLSEGAL